jgi:hypothetical protein
LSFIKHFGSNQGNLLFEKKTTTTDYWFSFSITQKKRRRGDQLEKTIEKKVGKEVEEGRREGG